LKLDTLQMGQWRDLIPEEVTMLHKFAF
jgi:16S rRNA U516 pseudouridylate synthase RsuA-like enzyme